MTHTVARETINPEDQTTIKAGAAYLGVHPSTIRRWIAAGELKAYRYGKRTIRIRVADLDNMGKQIAAATWEARQ